MTVKRYEPYDNENQRPPGWPDVYVDAADYDALRAEVERLTARNEQLAMAEAEAMAVVMSLEGTVERLRGQREPPHCPTCDCAVSSPGGGQ